MVKPLYIQRTGSVYFDADDNVPLTDLKPILLQHCTRKYRRIDRFTQLALIGAARCARNVSLPTDTPVYLASGKGPASNNIVMQEAIIRDREPPKPVQFINAVSNSVGFYIMQDHDLSGQALFVSREVHAFEAALRMAAVDLAVLPATTALLGVVDEITQPLEAQRARLGLANDVLLGEGSHWFLLSAEHNDETLATVLHNIVFYSLTELELWLKQLEMNCQVFFGQGMNEERCGKCLELVSRLPNSGPVGVVGHQERLWDGLNAGAICDYLRQEASPSEAVSDSLLIISCDTAQRYHVTLTSRI